MSNEYRHDWSRDGERCTKCGDKDWMGGSCSKPDAPNPTQRSDSITEALSLDSLIDEVMKSVEGKAEQFAAEAFPLPWNDHELMLVNRGNTEYSYKAGALAVGEPYRAALKDLIDFVNYFCVEGADPDLRLFAKQRLAKITAILEGSKTRAATNGSYEPQANAAKGTK